MAVFVRCRCVWSKAERKRDRRGDGVGLEIDDRDCAGGGGGSDCNARCRAGQAWVAAIDDVGAAVGRVLQDAHHDGIDPNRNGRDDGAEANGIHRIGEVTVWIANLSGRRAERDADDTEGAGIDSIACIGDDQLISNGSEVGPERVDSRGVRAGRGDTEGDGVRGTGGDYIERIGLRIDYGDGAVALIKNVSALGVGFHDTVDGIETDG